MSLRAHARMLDTAVPSRNESDCPPATQQTVVLQVGERFTTAVRSDGRRTMVSRTVSHGPVILAASQAQAARANGGAAARLLRVAAWQVAERARLHLLRGVPCPVVVRDGIARDVVMLGSAGGSRATREQVQQATDLLGMNWVERKRTGQPADWIEPMMIGSAVLEAVLEQLGVDEIVSEPDVRGPETD